MNTVVVMDMFKKPKSNRLGRSTAGQAPWELFKMDRTVYDVIWSFHEEHMDLTIYTWTLIHNIQSLRSICDPSSRNDEAYSEHMSHCTLGDTFGGIV